MMNEQKKWYAVYTRPRCEKKVASRLSRINVENYCPLNKVCRQWSDRKKIVSEPLFSSYVFVRVTEKEHSLLRQTDGVINMVYWLGKPAVIKDTEIETIQRFLNEHSEIKLEKAPVYLHDRVQVMAGALMDAEGEIIAVKNKSVKVALPSLGYIMYAEIETKNVRVLVPDIPKQYEIPNSKYASK